MAMAEKGSLVEMKQSFKSMVGFRAPAEISIQGAMGSAAHIIELDEKLLLHREEPTDFFIAAVSTSQLLNWCEQLQRQYTTGERHTVEDTETLVKIREKLMAGNLPTGEIKRLTKLMYVADPYLGAAKGIETLLALRARFPDVGLIIPEETPSLS